MALKVVDLRRLVQCEEAEATVKITSEDGDVYYYMNKVQKKQNDITLGYEEIKTGKWFPSIQLKTNNLSVTEYCEMIDYWFMKAVEDDNYVERIHQRYSDIPDYKQQIERAYNWLLDNPFDRRKDINRFVCGWLDRQRGRNRK